MSNTTVPFGLPACPLYASDSGTQQRRVSCSTIRLTHSFQPAMARLSGNIDGVGRVSELSNIRPSLAHPEYCTVTTSFGPGFSAPSPGRTTLEMSPEVLFTASAGGMVRSAGGAKAIAADCGVGGRVIGTEVWAVTRASAVTQNATASSLVRISFRSGA